METHWQGDRRILSPVKKQAPARHPDLIWYLSQSVDSSYLFVPVNPHLWLFLPVCLSHFIFIMVCIYIYIYRERERERKRWVYCHHFRLFISHMHFISLSTVQQTKASWSLSVRKAARWRNSFFQKFINGMLYWLVITPAEQYEDFIVFGCLRIVQKIQKELDDSNIDSEGKAAWNPHTNHYDYKRTRISWWDPGYD